MIIVYLGSDTKKVGSENTMFSATNIRWTSDFHNKTMKFTEY